MDEPVSPSLPLPVRRDAVLGQGWPVATGLTIARQAGSQMVRKANLLPRQPTPLPSSLIKTLMPVFSERSSICWLAASTDSFSPSNFKLPFAGFPGLPAHRRICFLQKAAAAPCSCRFNHVLLGVGGCLFVCLFNHLLLCCAELFLSASHSPTLFQCLLLLLASKSMLTGI